MPESEEKRAAYACDITYGTNTEFGFDYLRDNMARRAEHMVQRGHHYAIVDEVDSILIDEARTPLIISGPASDVTKLYYQFASIARALDARRRLRGRRGEEDRRCRPSRASRRSRSNSGVTNLYDAVSTNYVHQLGQALRAKELYFRDKDYLVDAGEVKIVDEFTGRTLDGRRWSDGLHQAVEAKERVRIQEENHTWATVTLQNYFRMYEKLAGMTGTAETEAAEFGNTYKLSVVPIPSNKPLIRLDQPDLIYKTEAAKFAAIVEDVRERSDLGQPILLGTASVEKSELLSRELSQRRDLPRGPQREAALPRSRDRGPGRAQARRHGRDQHGRSRRRRRARRQLRGSGHARRPRSRATSRIPRSSTPPTRARWRVSRPICEAEGDEVRELGGLYVLGSERHDSRRIDNQLRGRSGRQGDPGESRFYLSLQDDLLRLFATGAVSWVMDRTMPDDLPIEAKMVSKAIERAQNTVEGKNAEIRKDTLKYDEVMNEQRKVIYGRRQQVIDGEDIHDETIVLIEEVLTNVVDDRLEGEFAEGWDLHQLVAELTNYYPTTLTVDALAEYQDRDEILGLVIDEAVGQYEKKCEEFPGGMDTAKEIERDVMLQILDQRWRDHLSDMDYLRDGIHLRQIAQTDPLSAWQKEGYLMFEAPPRQRRRRLRALHHPRRGLRHRGDRRGRGRRRTRRCGHERQRRRRRARPNCRCTARRRSRCPSRATRSDATSRAGAVRVGSSSSAMADPKAENALREALATLEDLESRWSAAREYLKIDASRERHAVLSELVADPNLWDDQDRARQATTELGRLSNDLEQFDELRELTR